MARPQPLRVFTAGTVLALAVGTGPVWAQSAPPVGVVTALQGEASVARPSLPAAVALRFKDDVFVRDRINTRERSIVRVLLGGKAVVTVREMSELTIREEAGRSTVSLVSGKIGLAVLRERMRPGEVIEVHTPNAVAAVRGTVLVVERERDAAGGSGRARIDVLRGVVEVTVPGDPAAPAIRVGSGEGVTVNGQTPEPVVALAASDVARALKGLEPPRSGAEVPEVVLTTLLARAHGRIAGIEKALSVLAQGRGRGKGGRGGGGAGQQIADLIGSALDDAEGLAGTGGGRSHGNGLALGAFGRPGLTGPGLGAAVSAAATGATGTGRNVSSSVLSIIRGRSFP